MLSKDANKRTKALLLQSGNLFLGLFDGSPDEWGEGKPEMAYVGYARQPIAFDGTLSHAAMGNSNVIEIPRPPEGFATRAVTHCGIYDAATGGKLVLHGLLRRNGQPAPYPLGHDATFKIGANGVQFDLINLTTAVGAN